MCFGYEKEEDETFRKNVRIIFGFFRKVQRTRKWVQPTQVIKCSCIFPSSCRSQTKNRPRPMMMQAAEEEVTHILSVVGVEEEEDKEQEEERKEQEEEGKDEEEEEEEDQHAESAQKPSRKKKPTTFKTRSLLVDAASHMKPSHVKSLKRRYDREQAYVAHYDELQTELFSNVNMLTGVRPSKCAFNEFTDLTTVAVKHLFETRPDTTLEELQEGYVFVHSGAGDKGDDKDDNTDDLEFDITSMLKKVNRMCRSKKPSQMNLMRKDALCAVSDVVSAFFKQAAAVAPKSKPTNKTSAPSRNRKRSAAPRGMSNIVVYEAEQVLEALNEKKRALLLQRAEQRVQKSQTSLAMIKLSL